MYDPIKILIYKLPVNLRPAIVIFGGILIQLTLGTVYAYGNIEPYLVSYLRKYVDTDMSTKSMIWLYNLQGSFPFCFVIGGLLEERLGPRLTASIGAFLQSCGVLLSYFAIKHSFWALFVSFGVCFGLGLGIAYNSVLITAMKVLWLPKRVGLASGLIVAGFGCGAFVFSPIQTAFVNPENYEVGKDGYFDQEYMLQRVPKMFLLLGSIYFVMQLFGVMLLVTPDSEVVESQDLIEYDQAKKFGIRPKEMMSSTTFYWIAFSFFFNSTVGSIVAPFYKSFAQNFINDDIFLSWVDSISSVCNAVGRPIWGSLADRFSYQVAMSIASCCMCILLLTFYSTSLGGEAQFLFWVCGIFFSFSANACLFPAVTSKSFGSKHFGVNYGFVIMAPVCSTYIMGAIIEGLSNAIGYSGLFSIAAGGTFITFLLTTTIHLTKHGRGIEHKMESDSFENSTVLESDAKSA